MELLTFDTHDNLFGDVFGAGRGSHTGLDARDLAWDEQRAAARFGPRHRQLSQFLQVAVNLSRPQLDELHRKVRYTRRRQRLVRAAKRALADSPYQYEVMLAIGAVWDQHARRRGGVGGGAIEAICAAAYAVAGADELRQRGLNAELSALCGVGREL